MRNFILLCVLSFLSGCGIEANGYEFDLRKVGPYNQVFVYKVETDIEKCPLKGDRLASFQAVDESNQRVCRQACCSAALRFCELRTEQVCGAW